jgi:transcriptional regulator with XRE-family HTH domain
MDCVEVGITTRKSKEPDVIAIVTKVPDPVDRYVGSRVRMRRMTLRMSQEKLGGKLHLTFQRAQKYEKGTTRISVSRLQEMSHILQVVPPHSVLFRRRSADGDPRRKKCSGSVARSRLRLNR